MVNRVNKALPPLDGDADSLEQVMVNLITNALKYAAGSDIYVHAERHAQEILVVVGDNGPGIPDEQKDLIFRAFHSTKGGRGTGLGLAVTRNWMRALPMKGPTLG